MPDDLTYRGVALWSLVINDVEWRPAAVAHIRTRSERRRTNELDVEPEWATEAALDPFRRARESDSGSLEIVGLSTHAPQRHRADRGRVLKVWVLPTLEPGLWEGQSACEVEGWIENDYWTWRV